MISKIFIKGLEQSKSIDNFEIIGISSLDIYRKLFQNPHEFINIICNDSVVDFDKSVQVIYNHYCFCLNEKKNVNYLYKIFGHLLDDNEMALVSSIEENVFKLADNISYKIDYPIDYDESVDLSKLLSSINLRFKEEDNQNYVESLINYLKLNNYLSKTCYYLCFGISNILKDDEISVLSKELESFGAYLIDFVYCNGKNNSDILIDEDFCIL